MILYVGWKCVDCDVIVISKKRISKKTKEIMWDLCSKCYSGGKVLYVTEKQDEAAAFNKVIELTR